MGFYVRDINESDVASPKNLAAMAAIHPDPRYSLYLWHVHCQSLHSLLHPSHPCQKKHPTNCTTESFSHTFWTEMRALVVATVLGLSAYPISSHHLNSKPPKVHQVGLVFSTLKAWLEYVSHARPLILPSVFFFLSRLFAAWPDVSAMTWSNVNGESSWIRSSKEWIFWAPRNCKKVAESTPTSSYLRNLRLSAGESSTATATSTASSLIVGLVELQDSDLIGGSDGKCWDSCKYTNIWHIYK